MKNTVLTLALLLTGSIAIPAHVQNSAGQDVKDAGHDAKAGATKSTHAVKKGATKSTHAVKTGVHKTANKLSDKTQDTTPK